MEFFYGFIQIMLFLRGQMRVVSTEMADIGPVDSLEVVAPLNYSDECLSVRKALRCDCRSSIPGSAVFQVQ